jgi:toxin ParE1/3/4
MKLIFSAEARADLVRIGDYIARDNPLRALSFVEELEGRCKALLASPLAYPLVPRHESAGIRRAVHGDYLIFYRVEPEAVAIVHVLSGAMNVEALLFPEA